MSLVLTACGSSSGRATGTPEPSQPKAAPTGCETIQTFKDGKLEDGICETAIGDRTIIDLRDAWTPRLFAVGSDGRAPDFRTTYLALAAEHDTDGKPLPPSTALAELYGIVPSFAIVRQRFAETKRYACHDQQIAAGNDATALAKLLRPYGQEHAGLVKFMLQRRKLVGATLERARIERKVVDYTAFANDKELGGAYAQWKEADDLYTGFVAAQRLLVCEGTLAEKYVDGTFSWQLGNALELFQRRHFLIPNGRLDPETRAALATDPRELDFRFALRVLRERVVDATGLIEDGSAGKGPQPILGRILDPEAMHTAHGYAPLKDAAPDLIGPAVEAAAKQLGWLDAVSTSKFLAAHTDLRVALALPKPPAYHSKHMDLSAVIDRGDVWYDETPTPRVAWKRPALVLYLNDGKTKTPLIRWPTTIGGWSDVNIGGAIVKRWKESDVGPRVWRQLFAAPTWLPPPATPDGELVRWAGAGKWELKRSIMGPGPMAAFGMMLLLHEHAVKGANGKVSYIDNGIGTHGSAVVTSLLNGTSHGCHRLYNQLAVRLGSFLLAHRDHVAVGQAPESYRRVVRAGGKTFVAKLDTRGFVYELTPPIAVEVLQGNIRSDRKVPPTASVAAGAD